MELCRVRFCIRTFSEVKYCTSNALYSPFGEAHVRVTSVSLIYVAFIPVIGSGSENYYVLLLFNCPFIIETPLLT